MSKPRLLYVTHVDWGHIRQRPHHVATALSACFDVTVASPISRRRRLHVANPDHGLRRIRLLRLPGSYRSARVFALNNALCAAQMRARLPSRFDAVIVTAPECWAWVARWVGRSTLGYDCMDDALAFGQDVGVRDAKARLETALLARADKVLASSSRLQDQCVARGAAEEKVLEIPNGWDASAFPVQSSRPLPAAGALTLGYFGTLDAWLDFSALEASVRVSPDLTIRLIGPDACGQVPAHARIVVRPPVPHAALADEVADVDAFTLPFQVTDLTRAVDPVKLYEYIALGRPILSAYWPGLERFRDYVTFYDGAEQFSRLIADRALRESPPADRRAAFLADHTWATRATAIAEALGARFE